MANSKYEYVKAFERENYLLPETYIVIRVDGKGFHKLSKYYEFDKPNDLKALQVMNSAALQIMKKYSDVLLAYGDSDEYSFLLRRQCELYERREMKLCTLFSSLMSTYYVHFWNLAHPQKPIHLEMIPTFDARAVIYPNFQIVRDYFSWRQVDCHINNLYNTCFWKLIEKRGLTPQEAENRLKGTIASDKNEILFKECNVNYNNELEIFKKGTIFVREIENYHHDTAPNETSSRQKQKQEKTRRKASYSLYTAPPPPMRQALDKTRRKAAVEVSHSGKAGHGSNSKAV
ncbi:THG1 [Candida oxycetoniae]|uniref:tRNA(His) guanylyltransferase n=1 Tax=Candida oxycetoniae TaxID=497107 RepID=A0AAI9WYH4_9ASCO|nr:THG1 [Candida oxycetoniae]KAI3405149.2 THG1 [Candida oxycetoniae]